MDLITIKDLAVRWRVGVTDEERSHPQQLLLTLELSLDLAPAARADNLAQTIDYFALSERVRQWGEGQTWRLIETVAAALAQLVLTEFKPASVLVEIKKFVVPGSDYVSVKLKRP